MTIISDGELAARKLNQLLIDVGVQSPTRTKCVEAGFGDLLVKNADVLIRGLDVLADMVRDNPLPVPSSGPGQLNLSI